MLGYWWKHAATEGSWYGRFHKESSRVPLIGLQTFYPFRQWNYWLDFLWRFEIDYYTIMRLTL